MKQSQNPKNPCLKLQVSPTDGGLRLDVFCATHIETQSRNQIQKLNEEGRILVDEVRRAHHYKVSEGESIQVELPPETARAAPAPEKIPIGVVFEDDDILVVNKPAGMVVHPAHGNQEGTLVNAVLGLGCTLSSLGGEDRPGIVHRLDKDTSGVMVMVKTDAAYRGLTGEIKERKMEKTYHAIAWGNLGIAHRTIDAEIARHPVHRQKMTVVPKGGRPAVTEVFVVDSFTHFDYIRILTLTGRTHQIRVHLSSISHPVLGDMVYGARRNRRLSSNTVVRSRILKLQKTMQRHALHATKLSFTHPVSGHRLSFKVAIASDMRQVLETLHITDTGGNR